MIHGNELSDDKFNSDDDATSKRILTFILKLGLDSRDHGLILAKHRSHLMCPFTYRSFLFNGLRCDLNEAFFSILGGQKRGRIWAKIFGAANNSLCPNEFCVPIKSMSDFSITYV